MSIEKRIEKLEKHTEATEAQGPSIVYVLHDGEREPSQEERDRAMKDYVSKYGAVQPRIAIIVQNEHTKEALERIGERFAPPGGEGGR